MWLILIILYHRPSCFPNQSFYALSKSPCYDCSEQSIPIPPSPCHNPFIHYELFWDQWLFTSFLFRSVIVIDVKMNNSHHRQNALRIHLFSLKAFQALACHTLTPFAFATWIKLIQKHCSNMSTISIYFSILFLCCIQGN